MGSRGARAGQLAAAGPAPANRVWTIPNALSVLRLALLPVFVWVLLEHRFALSAAVLAVAGVTDLLDGAIARAYDLTSRLGQVLDPIADRLYILTTLLSLAWAEVVPWWLVVVLVSRDALILAHYPLVRRRRLPIPPVHLVGKAGTFALLGAFPLLVLGHLSGWWTTLALASGWALTWWGIVLYWVAGVLYLWQVHQMAQQVRRTTGKERV